MGRHPGAGATGWSEVGTFGMLCQYLNASFTSRVAILHHRSVVCRHCESKFGGCSLSPRVGRPPPLNRLDCGPTIQFELQLRVSWAEPSSPSDGNHLSAVVARVPPVSEKHCRGTVPREVLHKFVT